MKTKVLKILDLFSEILATDHVIFDHADFKKEIVQISKSFVFVFRDNINMIKLPTVTSSHEVKL